MSCNDFDALTTVDDTTQKSNKYRVVAFLLQFILGIFGAGRFYTGHKKTATIQLVLTLIGGIGLLVNFFLLKNIVEKTSLRDDLNNEIVTEATYAAFKVIVIAALFGLLNLIVYLWSVFDSLKIILTKSKDAKGLLLK